MQWKRFGCHPRSVCRSFGASAANVMCNMVIVAVPLQPEAARHRSGVRRRRLIQIIIIINVKIIINYFFNKINLCINKKKIVESSGGPSVQS